MTWFDDPDALAPDVVATRSFTITKRGFDIREVRAFLDDVAHELRLLRQGTDDLRRQLADADERLEAARQFDESKVVAQLGAETVRVLDAARAAALDITNRAEDDAAGVVRRAEAVAELARVEAGAAVDAMLEQARDEAGQLVEEARTTARDMVDQARAVRERMLADLGRRRTAVRQQLDALTAERDRLRAALVEVGRVHADALRVLDTPAPELSESDGAGVDGAEPEGDPPDTELPSVAGAAGAAASEQDLADRPGRGGKGVSPIAHGGGSRRLGPSAAAPVGRVSNAVRVIASVTAPSTDLSADADVAPAVATAAAGSPDVVVDNGRLPDDADGAAGEQGRTLARELAVASATLGRRIKRTLADEENALLVELEHGEAATDPVTIVADPESQRRHYADAALPPLVAATAGGADFARRQWPGAARVGARRAPRVGDLAEVLGEVVVSRLRDALATGRAGGEPTIDRDALLPDDVAGAAMEAGHVGVDDPATVVRGAYRSVRTAEIDGPVGGAVRAAFERGIRSVLAPATPLQWRSVDVTHPVGACPTCAAPPRTDGAVADDRASFLDGCPAILAPADPPEAEGTSAHGARRALEPPVVSAVGRGVAGAAKP